ncbi:MAG TPA: Rrf2 family transcriptional regulator [Nordella sp.]|nr:Rrf2 family transcriptional regulator [Nordella sp.]
MKMSEGVEWALHCCLTLVWLGDTGAVPTARLAKGFELPAAYLNKFLQALVKARILTSSAGVKGGFRLARPPEKITLLDVVTAIEGREDVFQCTEIRRRGAGCKADARDFARPCGIAAAMRRAEAAWRRELAQQTIADLNRTVPARSVERVRQWHAAN